MKPSTIFIIGALVGAYFYFSNKKPAPAPKPDPNDALDYTNETATGGATTAEDRAPADLKVKVTTEQYSADPYNGSGLAGMHY